MPQTMKKTNKKSRIRKGDEVVVIVGDNKGKTGRVIAVYPQENKILVEGVNVVKRSYRKGVNPAFPDGGIHDKTLPIHISNVMVADPEDAHPTRIGIRYAEGSKGEQMRVRYAKASGKDLKN